MHNLPVFLAKTEAVLRQAGWSPERRVSTAEYEALYAREGLTVVPEALEVLRSFGGIVVREPVASRGNAFGFDPSQALWKHVPDFTQPFEDTGTPMCLIGSRDSLRNPLYIIPHGEVCMFTHTGELIVVGNNIVEAIESIIRVPAY
ncbi:MAG TPA: SUKH-3 domain-containing protein [Armatimonadaceae bacterium]|jgi:hypothetical protein|nr:SUKH-3 domain-containing protein [Armatimonadaceae bacterium]